MTLEICRVSQSDSINTAIDTLSITPCPTQLPWLHPSRQGAVSQQAIRLYLLILSETSRNSHRYRNSRCLNLK